MKYKSFNTADYGVPQSRVRVIIAGTRKDIPEDFDFQFPEASHIIPVSENGADTVDNCLFLRADIHQLFDTNHLKLFPNGDIKLSSFADTVITIVFCPKL